MYTFGETTELYKLSGEEVVQQTAAFSRAHFDSAGLPVLICAYEEEQDLPVTLAALARSERPLMPYVIDNGSSDRTVEFAETMGAVVLEDTRPAKIFALASGIEQVAVRAGQPTVLLTDADTIMSRQWAETMHKQLAVSGDFSAVDGISITHHFGESQRHISATIVRSAGNLGKFYFDYFKNRPAKGRGHNMGFSFDNPSRAEQIIGLLDFNDILADDTQLMNIALKLGAISSRSANPKSIVLSRGDRFPNLSTVLRVYADKQYRKRELYNEWLERAAHADTKTTHVAQD